MQPRLEMTMIGKIRGADRNPKLHDLPSVCMSIRRFGFVDFPTVNEATGKLVEGHGRIEALKLIKREGPLPDIDKQWPPSNIVAKGRSWLCPVVRGMSWDSAAEAEAYLAAHNQTTMSAGWDDPLLASLLLSVNETDAGLTGLGFDEDYVQGLLQSAANGDDLEPSTGSSEEDQIPDPPKDPVTKLGDVWVLGDHRLICGSCREPAVVAKLLEGRKVNVAFTSPPYASQRKYDESSGFKPIPPDEYVEWFEAVQANVREVLVDDGSWFVNIKEHCDGGQRSLYVKDLTLAHARDWGWRFVDELCWTHHGFPGAVVDRFKNAWEPIFHFGMSSPVKCNPAAVAYPSESVMQYDKDARQSMTGAGWQGSGKNPDRLVGLALPRNVLRMSNGASTSVVGHSATFPVGLPTFFIKAYSDPGDLIFDPFMGSGTALIAAENEGRHAAGCEISPAYCDVIVERWSNLTGKQPVRNP